MFCLFLTWFVGCDEPIDANLFFDVPLPTVVFSDLYSEPPEVAVDYAEQLTTPEISPLNEYNISIEYDAENRIIRGIQSVLYTNRTDFSHDEIVFRLPFNAWNPEENMDILYVLVDSEEVDFEVIYTELIIQHRIEAGATIHMHIQFEAHIPISAARTGSNMTSIWAGAFLPVEAVFGSQGWHIEPFYTVGRPFILDTANYTVEITTPINHIVAGTGTKVENILGDHIVTTFSAQSVRDFAFAISENYTVSSISTPLGSEINLYHISALPVEAILTIAAETLSAFEEEIGAYPYAQLSIVETDMINYSEGFSNVIFVDSEYLRNFSDPSILCAEIINQWFSIIIGSNPIEEAWLSAGFSRFTHMLLHDIDTHNSMAAEHMELQSTLDSVDIVENRRLATPLTNYASARDYFIVQHQKAALMFYNLYVEMGTENFMDLLREYYRLFAFQRVSSADFIALANSFSEVDLASFFSYWLSTTELPTLP